MKRPAGIITLLLAGLLAAACPRKPGSPAVPGGSKPAGRTILPALPVEMTVKQRTTTPVPGSEGAVRLTVDDITRGQIMVSLTDNDGSVLLGQTSLESGKAAAFKLGGENYSLTLKALNNALIGEDFATFVISLGAAALTESARIERLLAHIGSMDGATFIRNSSEHSPADAAAHLRTKWKAADGEGNMKAETFVDQIASKSSLSDESYRIRMKDDTEVAAGEYLRKQLEAEN